MEQNPIVVMETSLGTIHIELFSKEAPISVKNFLDYVDEGFFNHLIFHRIIPKFMIQGGGFDAKMKEKQTRASIKNEAKNGLKNLRGTLAMARTSVIDSATSQFFINVVDNKFLDNGERDFGYAVFGKVSKGMDIVDKICAVTTTRVGGYENVPKQPVEMITVKRA